jgi:hypothetical protein
MLGAKFLDGSGLQYPWSRRAAHARLLGKRGNFILHSAGDRGSASVRDVLLGQHCIDAYHACIDPRNSAGENIAALQRV